MYNIIVFQLLLVAFAHKISALQFHNETNFGDIRQPRVTGRIVKVYSGSRAEPIICDEEGFKSDPNDCSIFYRCVTSGRGKFSVLRFSCGPGTVYDPETEVCNHPRNTKRSECNGGIFPKQAETIQSQENEIDNAIEQAPPSPINTILQFKSTTKRQSLSTIAQQSQKLIQPTVKTVMIQNPRIQDDICTNEGFVGDTENCKRFFRCVSNGRGGFVRYEFYCSHLTMWDEDIKGCNHAWAIKSRRCGRGSDDEAGIRQNTTPAPTYLPQKFGNRINEKDNQPSGSTHRPSTQRILPQTVKIFNRQSYGGDTDDDDDNDTTKEPDTTTTSTTPRPTTASSTTPRPATNNNKPSSECTSDGFMGDANDCKKFYRCVDNGRGGYTKYEFSCGDGTVWDSSIDACNHPWSVKNCGQTSTQSSGTSETTTTTVASTTVTKTSQGTQSTQTTTDSSDYEDPGYNNGQSSTSTTEKTQTKPIESSNSGEVCTKSGFVGDKNNCKKFYRCVDNGKGDYTKYEFSCGEGTVWDPKIEGCNHEWAVEECGESTQDINKVDSTTANSDSTSSSTKAPTTENDDYDVGYGPQESSTKEDVTSTTTTTRTTTSGNKNGDKCTQEGFFGDSKDCKKFYRCVSDGKGGYIRYEFVCGEGTVWDPEINACNHPSDVKNCGQSANATPEQSTSEESSSQHTTTMGSKETEGTSTTSTISPSSSSSSTTQMSGSSDSCTREGFMGDSSDCKKFYRCVDNQHGGYIKYEFTCGEGTVWDQEIQGCNHPTSTKECGGSGGNQPSSATTEQGTSSQNTDQEQQSDEIENEPSDQPNSTTMKSTTSPSKAECNNEGFYGDPDDCKKFYRCVDNGRGGYTKYDFTCGENTVWDQEIQGCNHASTNYQCSKGTQGSETSSNPSSSTTESIQTTSSENSQSTQSSTSSSSNNDQCTSEGFYGNANDCKKFYRCVSNGKGGYTKYDFTCGQGTVWVQEIQACDHDNDISSCSSSSSNSGGDGGSSSTSKTTSTISSSSQSQQTDREDDEYSETTTSSSSSSSQSSGTCAAEGYYGDENDCKKFYRCVDNGNGGYTKYDFTCGDGTAWDQELQTCNHENQVASCSQSNQSEKPGTEDSSQSQTPNKEQESSQTSQTTESTSTTKSDSSSSGAGSSSGQSSDKCTKEGYYGNTQDCKKFYRCVDNGNGGLTKYDFDCGEGTIWDQDVQTCNHPGDVRNPSCKDGGSANSGTGENESGGDGNSGDGGGGDNSNGQTSSTTQSSGSSSESTTQGSSNCTEDSSKKPSNITCPKAGFYPNPDDCKKFYRCVDWDGDGQRYSVFHFDCGEGTIWDPELGTCNYEDSVYPPRDCSSKQSASETESSSTTTEGTTTTEKDETTTQEQTTKEQTTQEQTTQEQTTQEQTTQAQTTQEQTTQEQTTKEQTTQEQTTQGQTTQEQTTTEQSTTTTTEESTTTTTEQSTTTTTTEQSTTTTEQTTTEQSTTEQSTTEQSTTEQSTTEQSTTEQSTTEQSTTEESTTEQSTTEQSTTEQSTTEQSTTEQSTTEESTTEQSTTEESTTEQSSSSNKDCPETDDDQHVYVCPTGFKRHPKYCNLFYQCEEDDDSHEVKVAVFNCPNNTIYDESKTQCVEEKDADKKCDGEMAERRRFKRLDAQNKMSPILVSKSKHSCKSAGHYPFERSDECSPAFLKCTKSSAGVLRGFVYRCPQKHVYWSVSRRCEPISKLRNCKNTDNSWDKRWEIPIEKKNVAKK